MADRWQHRGQVVEWNDEKGYGFIRDGEGARLFFHATDVQAGNPRPMPGDLVVFDVAPGRDGRPSARPVRMLNTSVVARPSGGDRPTPPAQAIPRYAAAAVLALAVFSGTAVGEFPTWLPLLYVVMGGLSFAVYWYDKSAAMSDAWRVPETTLHTIDMLSGIIGALVAQVVLRHKTRKTSFAAVTGAIVLVHAAVAAAVLAGVPLLVL